MPRIRRWLLSFGLWPRMAVAISLGFLALFVAFSALSKRALRDSTDRLLDERLVIAQMAAGQFDQLLRRAVFELEQARRFADFDPTDPDLAAEAHMLAHTYGRVGPFTPGITFLDAAGHVILSHPPGLYPRGTDLSDQPYVAQALNRRRVVISAPFHDPISNRPVAAVTIPIYDEDRFLGLLSGLVDLSGPAIMAPLQQAAMLGRTGHAALVDDQGRILASTFDLPFRAPGEHATFYRRAIAQGKPVIETVPFESDLPGEPRGHLHVMAFAPLKMAPWGVAVGGDEDETFAGVRRLQFGMALLGIVALLGTWAATLVGTRSLVRPVQRLTEAAQRIAEGNLDTPLQGPEGGEIRVLATALEQMRKQLLANIQELAARNEELRRQEARTHRLLRQVITAQEEERARLSRELHDEIGQTLTAVQLSLDQLVKSLPAADAEARGRLSRARTLTEQALADLRRVIGALRPGVLDQLGLIPALNWMADHTLRPLGLVVNIEAHGLETRLPGEIETILFRIAQEAMSNVARHSRARRLRIRLCYERSQVTMTLADDGQGFDFSAVTSPADPRGGLGLAGMQERASLAGGHVTVESAPGKGTKVRAVIPVATVVEGAK